MLVWSSAGARAQPMYTRIFDAAPRLRFASPRDRIHIHCYACIQNLPRSFLIHDRRSGGSRSPAWVLLQSSLHAGWLLQFLRGYIQCSLRFANGTSTCLSFSSNYLNNPHTSMGEWYTSLNALGFIFVHFQARPLHARGK